MADPLANEKLFPLLYTQIDLFLDDDDRVTLARSVDRILDQGVRTSLYEGPLCRKRWRLPFPGFLNDARKYNSGGKTQ